MPRPAARLLARALASMRVDPQIGDDIALHVAAAAATTAVSISSLQLDDKLDVLFFFRLGQKFSSAAFALFTLTAATTTTAAAAVAAAVAAANAPVTSKEARACPQRPSTASGRTDAYEKRFTTGDGGGGGNGDSNCSSAARDDEKEHTIE